MAKKIMVVDDDPAIVEYLVSVFTDSGYETCSASDGEKALGVLEKEKPDLITLDLEMPNEWGPRFYRKYTQNSEFKDIPVIVISGLAGIHRGHPQGRGHGEQAVRSQGGCPDRGADHRQAVARRSRPRPVPGPGGPLGYSPTILV